MPENSARLDAVAAIPTMLTRNTSGIDAPARPAIAPAVKNRLNAGAT